MFEVHTCIHVCDVCVNQVYSSHVCIPWICVILPILGGGLGGTRKGAPHECIKYSGRVDEK